MCSGSHRKGSHVLTAKLSVKQCHVLLKPRWFILSLSINSQHSVCPFNATKLEIITWGADTFKSHGCRKWASTGTVLSSSWNGQEDLISSALLMMPLSSVNVSFSCVQSMGSLNASYRWRSSWFWYYSVYTLATCSSVWEMHYWKWVQAGNEKTEPILLKAPSKASCRSRSSSLLWFFDIP